MEAGKLRHRIELQSVVDAGQDEYGQEIETKPEESEWETYATRWAQITPLSGKEAVNVKQLVATATHKVELRWLDGVSAEHRVKYGSRIFHIAAPPMNVGEKKETMILTCSEKV